MITTRVPVEPNRSEVESLLERVWMLTEHEALRLDAAWSRCAGGDVFRWQSQAYTTARGAWGDAWADVWAEALEAWGDGPAGAWWAIADALVPVAASGLIPAERFDALYRPWKEVVDVGTRG